MVTQMPDTSTAIRNAYDEWAHQYDTNTNSTRDLNAQVLRQQPFDLADKAVLEIGCGTGSNTIWLAPCARLVVGVDMSEGMLRKAHCRLGERNVHLLQANITKPWPLAPGFDVIVATLVLEHVYDLTHVFHEAHRVLGCGGLLYVGELHPYKQLQGVQAKYRNVETGNDVLVSAFRHTVSEYINGGIAAGFILRHVGEWPNEADADLWLLTLLFERT
jgi:ubiquinone/menaquinone biosynthesis C-methylase UbiE